MKKITVVTPTYNRAYILPRCYESLCSQTNQEFKWLIIDDGSTDNTKELVEKFKKDNKIEIKYVFQENHGKQFAINTAIDNCDTDYYAFLDSDDWYYLNTIEKFIHYINEIDNDNKIACIVARRSYTDNSFKQFKKINFEEKRINLTKLYTKYKFHAETCVLCKTEVLREVKYPILEDKFIPESYMFDKISQKYDVLFLNQGFSITEYLTDGYTKQNNKLYKNNPNGVKAALYQAVITNYGVIRNIKNMIWYINWCQINELNLDLFKTRKKQVLYLFCILPARLLFFFKLPKWMW
jgi:glycosyltransferase involved in cell wall biosynthesis